MIDMSTLIRALVVTIALGLSACSTVNRVVPPWTDLQFTVSEDINPDTQGRPSPVVVTVFELASRSVFDGQDFFALYDNAEQALGPDLLKRTEYEFEPGSEAKVELQLNPHSRYAAVIVAFRDLANARWREVVEVDPQGYDTFTVTLEGVSVFVRD